MFNHSFSIYFFFHLLIMIACLLGLQYCPTAFINYYSFPPHLYFSVSWLLVPNIYSIVNLTSFLYKCFIFVFALFTCLHFCINFHLSVKILHMSLVHFFSQIFIIIIKYFVFILSDFFYFYNYNYSKPLFPFLPPNPSIYPFLALFQFHGLFSSLIIITCIYLYAHTYTLIKITCSLCIIFLVFFRGGKLLCSSLGKTVLDFASINFQILFGSAPR